MSNNYAPQRRLALALEQESSQGETGLIAPRRPDDPGRQTALSIPEAVRALGEPLEPFFEACGGRRTISLAVWRKDRDALPKTYVFEQPFILVGRCPESDLTLSHAKVAFRHLYLQLLGGRWTFVILASDSKAAAKDNGGLSGWFEPGAELRVGPYTITHVAPETEARPGELMKRPAEGLPPAHLELVNSRSDSKGALARAVENSLTLIGSDRQCDIWLRHDSVSRIHASLVLTPQGLWIVDLLGRDGIQVDGRPVYWKRIHEGNELKVGRFRFRARLNAATSKRRRAPAKRAAPPKKPTKKPDPPSSGSLTGSSVLQLFRQMAEMQNQFFEHSQVQMKLMSEMLSQLKGNEQTSVRKDLARIDAIGQELKELQSQLATGSTTSDTDPELAEVRTLPGPGPADSARTERAEAAVPDEANRTRPADSRASVPALAGPDAVAAARLTHRMARLAQERNSRWRHVLKAFKGKPES